MVNREEGFEDFFMHRELRVGGYDGVTEVGIWLRNCVEHSLGIANMGTIRQTAKEERGEIGV